MYIALAWFADGPPSPEARERAGGRLDRALADIVPPTYRRHDLGGDDWGLTVLHAAGSGYRWPVLARREPVTAVSLGMPVGLDVTGGPVALAGRLLAGHDVHAGVVPPFGLLALDGDRRVSIQQDWLGMGRLFTARAGGVTAFCNRPGLLADFLGTPALPDLPGWASYTVCGHFGADLAPLRGVRLLGPGERVTGRRRDGGGWDLTSDRRYGVDDVVAAGLAARASGADAALDTAADALVAAVAGIDGLYDGDIALGLSGGKDSRLIAALFIAAGRSPLLNTNDDLAAEGETARRLVAILAERRGIRLRHRVAPAAAPAAVLHTGLRERVTRLQRLHDFQFPSTFTIRPAAGAGLLPEQARPASFTGAGGELAVGYWYPEQDTADADRAVGQRATFRHLMGATPLAAVRADVAAAERDRLAAILAHGEALGLRGVELTDYAYLTERVRRWYTSAYHVGMVTPFLAPGFVAASFAVTPAQKRARLVHHGLLRRFLPEWADVPYVTGASGASAATRVWDGDGVQVVCDLLDASGGELTALLDRTAVERAVARCVRGTATGSDQRLLQQFAWLAVASQRLEPATVRPATGAAYARAVRPPRQRQPSPALSLVARRVRFVRRSALGRRVWTVLRARAVRARAVRG